MVSIEAIGRLSKSLELQPIANKKNMEVANFTLFCRSSKETEKVICTAWNEIARTIKENTATGSLLYVKGRYKTQSWIDDKTRIRHERIYLIVEEFEFLDKKPSTPKFDI